MQVKMSLSAKKMIDLMESNLGIYELRRVAAELAIIAPKIRETTQKVMIFRLISTSRNTLMN